MELQFTCTEEAISRVALFTLTPVRPHGVSTFCISTAHVSSIRTLVQICNNEQVPSYYLQTEPNEYACMLETLHAFWIGLTQ